MTHPALNGDERDKTPSPSYATTVQSFYRVSMPLQNLPPPPLRSTKSSHQSPRKHPSTPRTHTRYEASSPTNASRTPPYKALITLRNVYSPFHTHPLLFSPRFTTAQMTFKLTTLILFTLTVLLIFFSSSSTVDALPYWRICGESKTKTQYSCKAAGGNWDGGSCGCDQSSIHNRFTYHCNRLINGKVHCLFHTRS